MSARSTTRRRRGRAGWAPSLVAAPRGSIVRVGARFSVGTLDLLPCALFHDAHNHPPSAQETQLTNTSPRRLRQRPLQLVLQAIAATRLPQADLRQAAAAAARPDLLHEEEPDEGVHAGDHAADHGRGVDDPAREVRAAPAGRAAEAVWRRERRPRWGRVRVQPDEGRGTAGGDGGVGRRGEYGGWHGGYWERDEFGEDVYVSA